MSSQNPSDIYQHMQAAVDIVGTSPHPTNKVAATIAGENFWFRQTNQWPHAIEEAFGHEQKIGNSSGTVHAETACLIIAMAPTEGASMFITDPPCPNCMKNMAEAGIAKLYIDHKGFDKDWAKRRGDDFENMSMRVAEKAGIDVHVIYRKEERFEIISAHTPGYRPQEENPALIESIDLGMHIEDILDDDLVDCGDIFTNYIDAKKQEYGDEPFAVAFAHDEIGKFKAITVDRHPSIGYTYETVESKEDKYSFILQPVNRLMMVAARHGLNILHGNLYSSRVPTSREFVNMIRADLTHIHIGDETQSRDEWGPKALKQLQKAQIILT